MLCGSLHVNPKLLLRVAYVVRDVERPEKPRKIHHHIALLMAKTRYLEKEAFDIIELMWFTCALQASERHDKPFALAGIASHVSNDFIDYEESIAEMKMGIIKNGGADTETKGRGLHLLSYVPGVCSAGSLGALRVGFQRPAIPMRTFGLCVLLWK